ncbi:HNH endonuclease [Rhodococcus sp. NPDC058514]
MGRRGRQPRQARNDIAATYDPNRPPTDVERRRERERIAAARRPQVEAARREWNRIGKRVSVDVFETYGRTCHLCGRPNSATTVDHVVPKSHGGAHSLANCRPACSSCNIGRGTRSVDEYRDHLRERGRLYDPNAIRSTPSRRWFG